MRAPISLAISVVSITGSMRRWMANMSCELAKIGLDRRLHVGILQLAGKLRAVVGAGAMHLAERSGGGGMVLEARRISSANRSRARPPCAA